MLKNYFKIAIRLLWKDKAHTFINVLGLGLGVACCILIALFVREEWTYDSFHVKSEDIYRAYVKEDYGENEQFFNTTTPFPLGPVLKENFPEVVSHVRIAPSTTVVTVDGNQFSENVTLAGTDLFKVFDFKVNAGDGDAALQQQTSVVITQRTANKYFGDQDPLQGVIGIRINNQMEDFEVKAVIENVPGNSSIQFDLLISDLNLPKIYSEQVLNSAWFNVVPETYLLLKDGTLPNDLETKFPSLFKTILGEERYSNSGYQVGLQPIKSIHFDTSFPPGLAPLGNPNYTYILAAVALLVLLIACINFVTLAVGRSLRRTKEVGIRKIVGADRRQLAAQFLGESLIITCISILFGFLVARLGLSLFNELAGKQLMLDFNLFMLVLLATLTIIIGMFAGSYPAYILSLFKPIDIVKGGSGKVSRKQNFRKLLVGIQIFISVFLITSTLFMRQQLRFLQEKDLGYDQEQLAVVPLNIPGGDGLAKMITQGFRKAAQLQREFSGFPEIISTSASSHEFGKGNWTNIGFTDDQGSYRNFNFNVIDENFVPTLKLALAAGRNFNINNPADQKSAILINESFAKAYGWENPLGKRIPGKFSDHEVIGVIKDFNYDALYSKVEPLVLAMDPMIIFSGMENIAINNSPIPKIILRLRPGNHSETIGKMKTVWNKTTSEGSFDLSFVDQTLATQYRADQNLGKIINISTWLSIIIGSLGLYALASLAMQSRLKEISIRRVLGATESRLLLLLSKDYIYLVVVAFILSIPFTWYLMQTWLANFEYRVSLGADKFLMAGGLALVIALGTISYQAVKTAMVNPVKTLKDE